MGEIIITIVKWTVRIGIILSAIFAFTMFLNFSISTIAITLSSTALGDVFALIQMWLPFDLDVVLTWLFTAATLYLAYRLTMFAAGFINKFVGEN